MPDIKINDTVLSFNNIYYVDPADGEDAVGRGSQAQPLKTVYYAVDLCATTGDAIYALEGMHDVTSISLPYGKGGLDDSGKSISFFGVAGKTIFHANGTKNTGRDHHVVSTTGIGTKIYHIIFKHTVGSRTVNYTVALFGNDGVTTNAEIHNCVILSDAANPSFVYDNSNTCSISVYNSLFIVKNHFATSYSAAVRPKKINCACTKNFQTTDIKVTCKENVDGIRADYFIQSGVEGVGTGTNPDGSVANIGVHGGKFAWSRAEVALPPTLGQLRTRVEDMDIGDYIPCTYNAFKAGVPGTFFNFGKAGEPELSPFNTEVAPYGMFYFIKVKRGLLIADRVVQTNVAWTALNQAKYAEGVGHTPTPDGFVLFQTSGRDNALENPDEYKAITTNVTYQGATIIMNADEYAVTASGEVVIEYDAYVTGYYSTAPNHLLYLVEPSANFTAGLDVNYGIYQYITAPVRAGYSTLQPTPVLNKWSHFKHVINFTARTQNVYVDGVLRNPPAFSFKTNIPDGKKLLVLLGVGSFNYASGNTYKNLTIKNAGDTSPRKVNFSGGKKSGRIRSLYGGNGFKASSEDFITTDAGYGGYPSDNEWDSIIVRDDLAGKIRAGDDSLWMWSLNGSHCVETQINGVVNASGAAGGTGNRVWRGYLKADQFSHSAAGSAFSTVGFRPVFEYKEG